MMMIMIMMMMAYNIQQELWTKHQLLQSRPHQLIVIVWIKLLI